jgi:hypothetical protein
VPRRANATSFAKGIAPWNKGMKGYLAGRVFSEEHRRKIGLANSGSRGGNWKGGVTPENTRLRKTAEYQAWRSAVFERDDYTCQMCGARNQEGLGRTVVLNADHIMPFWQYPDLRLSLDNGRTLCVSCHRSLPTHGRPLGHRDHAHRRRSAPPIAPQHD